MGKGLCRVGEEPPTKTSPPGIDYDLACVLHSLAPWDRAHMETIRTAREAWYVAGTVRAIAGTESL